MAISEMFIWLMELEVSRMTKRTAYASGLASKSTGSDTLPGPDGTIAWEIVDRGRPVHVRDIELIACSEEPGLQEVAISEGLPRNAIPRLDPLAIRRSSGMPLEQATDESLRIYAEGNELDALVANMDIRRSTLFMWNIDDFNEYTNLVATLVHEIRYLVIKSGGWFDKFTGDGAVVFWPLPRLTVKNVALVLKTLFRVHLSYETGILSELTQIAGIVPFGFGLATGVDYGKCRLSDLQGLPFWMDGRIHDHGPATGHVTILGRPVVGAARMASQASAGTILANERVGSFVRAHRNSIGKSWGGSRLSVDEIGVHNKDIKGRQRGYRISYRP